jgi:hypothetical protein
MGNFVARAGMSQELSRDAVAAIHDVCGIVHYDDLSRSGVRFPGTRPAAGSQQDQSAF